MFLYIRQFFAINCASMHKIRWDDLQFVLAVAEHRSLSGAARALGVNHTTVLRRILALEEALGVTLFDRPPGGYRIKPEAREIISTIETMGRSVDRLKRVLPMMGKGLEGSLRLTTTDSFADIIVPPHLNELAQLHPKLDVELVVSNMPVDMSRPEAEVTLRPAKALPEGLTGRRIGDMTFQVFAHPDYLADHSGVDYADHRWLGITAPGTRSPVGQWQEANIAEHIGLRTDSFLTLARMAEVGLGPAMIPTFVGRHSSVLRRAPQFQDEMSTGLWIATHPDLMHLERVTAMLSFFEEAVAKDAALLA